MKKFRKVRLILALSACVLIASCRHHLAAVAPSTIVTGPVVLPPGTVLALIAAETIDSAQPAENRTYAGVISQDIAHGEPQKLIPSGSPASIVLMQAGAGWQLGLSSIMVNGESYLVKSGNSPAMPLGTFLGGVPGRYYPGLSKPGQVTGLIVSESAMQVVSGSLLTFRLEREIILIGSGH